MHFLRTLLPFMAASFAVAGVIPLDHASLVAKDLAGRQGIDAPTVVAIIQALAAQVSSLEETIETASGLSTSAQVSALSQNITSSLNTIITEINQSVGASTGVVFSDPTSCQEIGDALNQFATVLDNTFHVLISEAPVFLNFNSAAPIAQELGVIQPEIDTLANVIIQALPCQTQAVKQGQALLDNDFSSAIAALA
ncbi:hypothetical protein DACRYDRAFT_103572 [Dacryopinax primogenitus]|uniref:Hydrophobic surface binding protein n=1 Tax=Dacryopinax primogenitus (strain DJM 731) TaxID=1858805 RepID=M5GH50_DACPD|nr:uncharacterized protein DACRYDRAFT_103572 [Dacryopinax primogenitus]EJU06623.1 hypothetical protein DACRYDRAFT_103572 [Dacryopinax primogenitus]